MHATPPTLSHVTQLIIQLLNLPPEETKFASHQHSNKLIWIQLASQTSRKVVFFSPVTSTAVVSNQTILDFSMTVFFFHELVQRFDSLRCQEVLGQRRRDWRWGVSVFVTCWATLHVGWKVNYNEFGWITGGVVRKHDEKQCHEEDITIEQDVTMEVREREPVLRRKGNFKAGGFRPGVKKKRMFTFVIASDLGERWS